MRRRDSVVIVIAVLLVAALFMAGGIFNKPSPSPTQPNVLVDGQLFLKQGWAMQQSNLVPQDGSIISKSGFNTAGWHPTSIPSTVLAALVENAVYSDPYYSINMQSIPDLTTYSWWYRVEFPSPSEYQNRTIWLHLDGINYKANIWLNGQKIADNIQVQGMHRLFEFDITDLITFTQNNCLALGVFAPTAHDLWDSWVDWNPTPPDKDMGIWQDVYLDASGLVAMRHPYVVTDLDLPSLNVAHLNISAELTNVKDVTVNGVLKGTIKNVTNTSDGGTSEGGPGNITFSKTVSLGPKETKLVTLTSKQISQLNITNPRIWWPNLVGSQHLYDLALEIEIDSEVSDSENVRFGIREVSSYLSAQGYRIFKINGQNILIRGGGWAPDMMFRPLPERTEAEIKYARDMNLNAIRMEGKLGTDGVWDYCDKYGIMVMAGWCCCCHWEEWSTWDATDRTVAFESEKDQILRIRNHPSLLVWLYGSDGPPPTDIEQQYLNILNTFAPTLPHLSSATADSTPLTGATGVKMNGPYAYEPPIYYYLKQAPGGAWSFGTEMGPGENVPPIESMREMLPPDHLWPIDSYWYYHCGDTGSEFDNLNIYTNALNNRYGTATGVEEYCRKAQLMNYESMRAELEAWGRNKYNSTGVITWRFNQAWPSLIWQHYDYYLRSGGSYFGAKTACEPLHVQYGYNDSRISVINSYYQSYSNLRVNATVYNYDMIKKYTNTATINVGPDSTNYAFTIPSISNLTTTYFLKLKLEDNSGKLISSNFYWLSTQQDTLRFSQSTWYYTPQRTYADFTALSNLPPVELYLSYQIENKGEDIVAHITIENPTDDLAFFIHAAVTKGPQGKEVLPILWDDNYFSLLPGESREVHATVAVKDLSGAVPVVKVGGWNIANVRIKGDMNTDHKVDVSDLCILGWAYLSDPLKPDWNATCDLNKDHKIDTSDLSSLNKNYGKTLNGDPNQT